MLREGLQASRKEGERNHASFTPPPAWRMAHGAWWVLNEEHNSQACPLSAD